MTDPAPIVRLTGLRLDRGGRAVLEGIDLTVPRGSVTAVLGPSGSGKSTLLAGLTGELVPAAGTVEVLGAPLPRNKRALLELRQGIGVLLQGNGLLTDLTVAENVGLPLRTHTDLPVLTYNSPWRNGEGVEFTSELVQRLIERLPNYIGMKDASFHSEKFMEISRVALRMRPGFSIIMGLEHLLASYPLGACGSFSSCGAIAPNLCNRFFAALEAHDWETARQCQYKITKLYRLFKDQYPSSLKGAMISMGRNAGPIRPPLPTASKERVEFLCRQLEELDVINTEPHGW